METQNSINNTGKVTIFNFSGTWTKDPRAQFVTIYTINGGGGGGGQSAGPAAGNGGAGGFPGGKGGSLNGTNSGAGGKGGDGQVIIIEQF